MAMKPSASSWLASVVAHAGLSMWMLVGSSVPSAAAPAEVVEMTIAPAEPPPPMPTEVSAPPPPLPAAPRVEAHAAKEPRPIEQPKSEPAPVAPEQASDEPVLDLSGTTLTSERGSFVSRTGNGGAMNGPIGAGGARPAPASGGAASSGPVGGGDVALTPKENLSRLPAPPDLADRLLALYPSRAREAGDAGQASLSLVVLPDGRVGAIDVRSATSADFGRACKDTVAGSRWAPPLDRNGKAVATRVGYTCRFDVR
jgi:TonB family protein